MFVPFGYEKRFHTVRGGRSSGKGGFFGFKRGKWGFEVIINE
jgi:hypothetical protein